MCRHILNTSIEWVFKTTFSVRERCGLVSMSEYVDRMIEEDRERKENNAD